MASILPPDLRAAIADLTAGQAAGCVSNESARMSETYRAGGGSSAIRSKRDIAAYLHARLPATFAAVDAALRELEAHRPDFAPQSLLDVGCGPGTAMFAALAHFPALRNLTGLDINQPFLDAAAALLRATDHRGDRAATLTRADFRKGLPPDAAADLVTAAYALVETSVGEAEALARRLYAAARDTLVLVEPGSTAGFERLRAARTALIADGAHVVAPCTHARPCPIVAPDWCHFSVRLARSREHQRAKSAVVPFEDEKFAYLVATRRPAPMSPGARIIGPPHTTKGDSAFKICNAQGIEIRRISRRDPQHKAIRKLNWGDFLPDQRADN